MADTIPVDRPVRARPYVRLAAAVGLLSAIAAADAGAQPRGQLQSFYATESTFQIVHVEPSGAGVKVRVIDLDFHDDRCWQRIVRAYDVELPHMSVAALAGPRICALDPARV